MNNPYQKSYEKRELRRNYYIVVVVLCAFMAFLHNKVSTVHNSLQDKHQLLVMEFKKLDKQFDDIKVSLDKMETLLEGNKDVESTTSKEGSKKSTESATPKEDSKK